MCRQSVFGVCLLILMAGLKASAQVDQLPELFLTTNKTTVVVSHFKIKSVDRGSRDVLAQKVPGTDTILEVKAARADFPETNLTILTGDGAIHMFLVRYIASPTTLKYLIAGQPERPESAAVDDGVGLTEEGFGNLADSVLKRPSLHCGKAASSCGAKAIVSGIYIHGEALFFGIRVKNRSNIGYNIGQMNFYIRDKEQTKRTASQVLTMSPLFVRGEHEIVNGKSAIRFVVSFQKFTIPDEKVLFIIIKEKNGGRLLRLRITNKELLRARGI